MTINRDYRTGDRVHLGDLRAASRRDGELEAFGRKWCLVRFDDAPGDLVPVETTRIRRLITSAADELADAGEEWRRAIGPIERMLEKLDVESAKTTTEQGLGWVRIVRELLLEIIPLVRLLATSPGNARESSERAERSIATLERLARELEEV